MKKSTGFLLLGVFSLLITITTLHGCGGNDAAPAPSGPSDSGQPKFTIVGAGS